MKWAPSEEDGITLEQSLNDADDSNETSWNQFEVNEKKFGVKTTYDESLYTIELDKIYYNDLMIFISQIL